MAQRLDGLGTTIFAEMSALAERTGAINLGQGFPDTDGPAAVLDGAIDAIRSGRHNQYPPGLGIRPLREAIAEHQERFYGLSFDPDSEILVTAGATEAIAASLLALVEPGDEVIALEPYYDSYTAGIAMAGGVRVPVTLRSDNDFRPNFDDLRAAVSDRSRVLLLNSPHNPTGAVLRDEDLAEIAEFVAAHDLLVICDEVYEHVTFDGVRHRPLATFPEIRDRIVTVSSAGKTFSVTGWKIGWACAEPELLAAVRTAKQFLTYVSGGPFQPAVADALRLGQDYYDELATTLRQRRDQLCDGLAELGFEVFRPAGTYFVTTDVRSLGYDDGTEFCRMLPERCGVVAIPHEVFYDHTDVGRPLVRWAFCKRAEVLEQALDRLSTGLGRVADRGGSSRT